jgi:signal transduction histidine kinase/PAS domain-containing protein
MGLNFPDLVTGENPGGLSLRGRLFLLVFAALVAMGSVTWLVIRPRFEQSVIDERLLLLSQQQARRLEDTDNRLRSWIELVKSAAAQLNSNPAALETVFKQYIRLFPDLEGIRVIQPSTGEYVDIKRVEADSLLFDTAFEEYHPVLTDSTFRFAWQYQKCALVHLFGSGDDEFQMTAIFTDTFLRDQLLHFGTRDAYFLKVLLNAQVLESDEEIEDLQPASRSVYTVVNLEYNGRPLVGLSAGLNVVNIQHAVLMDEEIIAAPVHALFVQTGILLGVTLLVLIAGGWGLSWVVQRPIERFMDDIQPWSGFSFDKPIRQSSLPEFSRLTAVLNAIRERLAHYQSINVERIILEQEKNQQLIQFATEMVALLDENGRFTFVNNRLRSLFLDLEMNEPESLQVLLSSNGVGVIRKNAELRNQGDLTIKTEKFELSLRTENHEYILACEKIALSTAGSGWAGGMLFLHDLTEDRLLDRTRTDMINLIIHELRNPVTGVVGLADLLLSSEFDEPTRKEFFGLIKSNGQTMVQLINRFLDIARLESNRIVLKFEPVLLEPLVKKTADGFAGLLQQRMLKLEIRSKNASISVSGVPDLLSDAIRNLISNAIKYGPDNRTIFISIDEKEPENSVTIAITDYGYGIAAEHREKVFEKFYRVKDRRIKEVGTGLGLPYIKEIVEKHGGKMKLESGPEYGCTFTLELPRLY